MTTTEDGSAKDFVNHWDWAASKGLMPRATALSLKAATTRVLQIEGGEWESIDVRDIDVESLLNRFEILAKKDFTGASLSTYQSRFRRAHQLYLSYLKDPSAYRPATRAVAVKRDRPESGKRNGSRPAGKITEPEREFPSHPDMVKYPFPIRPGVIAQLQLPEDLQKAEAARLCSFLNSLAIDPAAVAPTAPLTDK